MLGRGCIHYSDVTNLTIYLTTYIGSIYFQSVKNLEVDLWMGLWLTIDLQEIQGDVRTRLSIFAPTIEMDIQTMCYYNWRIEILKHSYHRSKKITKPKIMMYNLLWLV